MPARRLAPELFRKRLLIECGWSRPRFLSVILYTCAEFDEGQATSLTQEYFAMTDWDAELF